MNIRNFSSGKCTTIIDGNKFSFNEDLYDGKAIRVRTNPNNGKRFEIHGVVYQTSSGTNWNDYRLSGSYYLIS